MTANNEWVKTKASDLWGQGWQLVEIVDFFFYSPHQASSMEPRQMLELIGEVPDPKAPQIFANDLLKLQRQRSHP